MRAKFINEFERGFEPKTALGIGPKVAKIRKCFRDLDIPDENYIITPTKVIFNHDLYLVNKNVTWLPNNLEIYGRLYLRNTPITELPDDLQVKKSIYVDKRQTKLIAFIKYSKFANKLIII
jgi:hypothetical protein